jgi:hypothetical protein
MGVETKSPQLAFKHVSRFKAPVNPGGERYFNFFRSAIELMGVLNHPKGSGPMRLHH